MINWNEIELKGKTSGQVKTTCPSCSADRKNSKEPCLSVNITDGMAHCWNCDDVSFRDSNTRVEQKNYSLPNQKWQNYTSLSDKLVKWFKIERGISQSTLIECKITEENTYIPRDGKEMNCVAFNYFEGDVLVNKKFRSANKGFTQVKEAKKIPYGINDIIGQTEAYIVEGEIDKLALWEIGVKNVISVPNGAKDLNDFFENCAPYFKAIKKWFIAVDMDAPGQELEDNLIRRFGKWKCERINFKGKDANDDLIDSPLTLEESINNPTKYPVDGAFGAEDISAKIDELFTAGLARTLAPNDSIFKSFNDIFKILLGQLTVVTGIPQHGKSNWLEWYLLNLINDRGLRMAFYSPEHFPLELHQSFFAEKAIGKPFFNSVHGQAKMTQHELNQYKKWSQDKIYLTAPEKAETPDWDWIFKKFEELVFRFGIKVFVIDAFNKVKLHTGELIEINRVLAQLTLFAQMHNVHIFLIAHPTKMQKEVDGSGRYKVPQLYDVKGSGDFYDQTHNGLTVYRWFNEDGSGHTDVYTTKVKFKHQGLLNKSTGFNFIPANGRFYPLNYTGSKTSPIFKIEPLVKDVSKQLTFN